MPSRASSPLSSRFSDSAAFFTFLGSASGCDSDRLDLNLSRRGGCCLTSSCAGKSRAFRAPANAPSFDSSQLQAQDL